MDKVYNSISSHFDHTRFSIWKSVREFLDTIPKYSIIADIGCGNGKNARYRQDIITICNDISSELLKICNSKRNKFNYDCILANGLNLPYKNEYFDYTISIAVLHHLDTYKKRIQFIKELIRITKKTGKLLLTVWANEQIKKTKWIKLLDDSTDYLIPWDDRNGNTINRYYHLFPKEEIILMMNELDCRYSLLYEMDNWFIYIN